MPYQATVTQFSKMLGNLSAMLDNAEAFAESKSIDVSVLLNSRLAADQFHLIKQVQIACDSAKLGAARLAGKQAQAPIHEDNETTCQDLKRRIESVIQYLAEYSEQDFSESDHREISIPWWKGKAMNGFDFLTQYVTPNFYFHVTTAYAILRHNGVSLGKQDYLGELPFTGQVPAKQTAAP